MTCKELKITGIEEALALFRREAQLNLQELLQRIT